VHFGQGGGPSTLQDAGFERSHPGVAVGVADATFDLFAPPFPSTLDLPFSLPTAARGKSVRTINKIVTAIFLSFIKFSCFSNVGSAIYPTRVRRLWEGSHLSSPGGTRQDPKRHSRISQ
jgi:hypothetical protein